MEINRLLGMAVLRSRNFGCVSRNIVSGKRKPFMVQADQQPGLTSCNIESRARGPTTLLEFA